jgi:hypothetical protein
LSVSLIITTACGDPLVAEQRGGHGQGQVHARRIEFLNERILPAALELGELDEVIVAGRPSNELRDLPDVTYLWVPPARRDRSEALHIREIATRYSTGDILIYTADDHALSEDFVGNMPTWDWDILTPVRINGADGNEMNSGDPASKWHNFGGYSPAHCQVLKRHVWAGMNEKGWMNIEGLEAWDIPISTFWRNLGFELKWTDEIHAVDLEAREGEE